MNSAHYVSFERRFNGAGLVRQLLLDAEAVGFRFKVRHGDRVDYVGARRAEAFESITAQMQPELELIDGDGFPVGAVALDGTREGMDAVRRWCGGWITAWLRRRR
ncbi:hypothetical protein [Ancylobacter rudongensis]|uniref:Uncharacterized protein n=1 Tax=Ancylobacter rudongensis TaxID=177413 RepID=A0A1G4UPG3_9HYPH|nr:hypothetical protein [Ancylobacter rudongensis]SCW95457.1 hypothetical protein SAMN05660859_0032 [Ancylobacter rudongensis]